MHTACSRLIPGDWLPITLFCIVPLLIPDDVVRRIQHVMTFSAQLLYTKCMITFMGLAYMKCIRHMQLIIILVHLHIVGVSTWNYMLMNAHEMNS